MRRLLGATAIMIALLPSALRGKAEPKSDAAPQMKQLEESLGKWTEARKACAGAYSYKVRKSYMLGNGHETTIVVRANKVAERRYRAWETPTIGSAPGEIPPKKETTWTEKGKQLGSHKKGAPLRTLDDLYKEAKQTLSRERSPHEKIYLRFDKKGLLNACFTVDTRIMDDAPIVGVSIQSVTLETKAPSNSAGKMKELDRETLSTHETLAAFEGVKFRRCMGRTALCPDRCSHSGEYATFRIEKYIKYEKPGKYGDAKQKTFSIRVSDFNKKPVGGADRLALIRKLKPGDQVNLSWRHDYVTRGTAAGFKSKSPERPITALERAEEK